jgi:3-hydroxyacyl-CoA dehydrogenase / enoyl-CoA hydratase / 3-hydroxybutyryl-CoA epimerase
MNTPVLKHWKIKEGDGVLWCLLDVADSVANVLSNEVLEELETLLEYCEAHSPKGLVISSAKSSGFIAGADVREFSLINSYEEALQLIQKGQGILDRLERLNCPTVALINGFCLGGGTELALACDYRIALDEPRTRIGLPEVKLGIHPGFGGSMRSVRTMGPLAAMGMMLTGSSLDAGKARRTGLVDDKVPERQLRSAARHFIDKKPPARRMDWKGRILNNSILRPLLAARMRRNVAEKAQKRHYPAPYALIDVWERNGHDERLMLSEEARSVARLITEETARNLIRVFHLQTGLKALGDKKAFVPGHVHVIGGGVMGGDIAAWCALQGLHVSVQDTNSKALAAAIKRASSLFNKRFRAYPNLADAAMDRLIIDESGHGVRRADVIIEAIIEDLEIKQNLFRKLEPQIKPTALLATNTSSIPLEQLGQALDRPERLVGLHFFNPVSRMPLLEVVYGPKTGEEAVSQARAFARHIDRLPLPVRSAPGFLVNRILMPYLLEAVLMEQEGLPVEVIDQAARDFGMPMGPLELGDAVGLDVCLYVGRILATEMCGEVPEQLEKMVTQGRLGKKTGHGYYRYNNGKREVRKTEPFAGSLQDIQDRLILRYLNEAVACLREGIIDSEDKLDAGMIFGTGFAPFRGGPLHYVHSVGVETIRARLDELEQQFGERFRVDEGWDKLAG